jgi:NAD(P)-dependent dehydrogenase (short-subunit alcohol dehydrogenase family)
MDEPVAIITGAGRGIGRAAAVELAAKEFRLTLIARTAQELDETARLAGGGLVFPADVKDAAEIERAIQTTVQTYGRLDAIVHCAGVAPVRMIDQMTPDQWHEVIDTNLSAAFYLCRSAWPIFTRQQAGVVVNISSEASRDPFDGFTAYAAAKAGINLFGKAAAREGAKIGVRVHTIAPAAVETAMFRAIVSEEQYPRERTLTTQDVARVILQCVQGDLRHASGEVIYLHKVPSIVP